MPIYFRNAPVREPFIYRPNPAAGGLPFRENLICFMNRKAS